MRRWSAWSARQAFHTANLALCRVAAAPAALSLQNKGFRIRRTIMRPSQTAPCTRRIALAALTVVGLVLGLFGGVGSAMAETTRESRPIQEAFDALRIAGSFQVELRQGENPSVVLEGDPRVIAHIKSEVHDGELVVHLDGAHIGVWSPSQPHLVVTAQGLRSIRSEGASDIRAESWNTQGDVAFALAGAGEVHIASLTARKVSVQIAGTSDVELTGTVNEQDVKISGAGRYQAQNLKSAASSVSVSGAGDVVLWATQSLSISVAGIGDVKYYGTPTVARSVAGVGNIEALGEKP